MTIVIIIGGFIVVSSLLVLGLARCATAIELFEFGERWQGWLHLAVGITSLVAAFTSIALVGSVL